MGRRFDDVLIAVPNAGYLRTELFPILAMAAGRGAQVLTPIGLKPCARARNECVAALLSGPREWLWFLDHDVLPPDHALEAMLQAAGEEWQDDELHPVVSGVYRMRSGDPVTAKTNPENGEMQGWWGPGDDGVHRVERTGHGCVLIHREVFANVPEMPWYEDRVWHDGRPPTGQDWVFCEKLEEMSVALYAHYGVVCRHRKEVDL